MEKISLRPSTQELLTKGPSKEGHLDVFTYDYGTDRSKDRLGNLFIIGNIQQASDGNESGETAGSEDSALDVNYALNLVASLAKREYYSKTDSSPKEAFNLALKKINDVVDEFFKNKETRINIGIFAIAGESIYISKLGKFKIILTRDGRNIDIINNIDLFSREKVQEKEFSHIVSGKVQPMDKVFAFFPSRSVLAREKGLKENLPKLTGVQFMERLNEFKGGKNGFACAALYIELNEIKEPAIVNNQTRASAKKEIRLSPVPMTASSEEMTDNEAPVVEPVLAVKKEVRTVSTQPKKEVTMADIEEQVPRIISSEFSLGKKDNPILVAVHKTVKLFPRPKNKNVFFVAILVLILGAVFIVKSVFFVSPVDKQAASTASQAQSDLKLAKAKITQNDSAGARQILVTSILSLGTDDQSQKIQDIKAQLYEALDSIDQATEASLTIAESLPKEITDQQALIQSEKDKISAGKYPDLASFVDLAEYSGNVYALGTNSISKIADAGKAKSISQWLTTGIGLPANPVLISADGKVYVLNKSGLLTVYYKGEKSTEFNTYVLPGDKSKFMTNKESDSLYLVNKGMNRIYLLSKSSGSLSKTIKIGSTQPISDAYLGAGDQLYITTSDNKVWKVQN